MTFSFNVKGLTPQDVNTGSGETPTGGVFPKNIAGLSLWLDGQCNTRQGNDHTKTYLENLVWSNTKSTENGNLEYFTNTSQNIWDGDFLKLGTYAYYPRIHADSVSLEAVVKITKSNSITRIIYSSAYASGLFLVIGPDDKPKFQYRQGSNYGTIISDSAIELDTPYYIAGIFDRNSNASLYIKGLNTDYLKTGEVTTDLSYKDSINASVGANASTTTDAKDKNFDGLSIGMVRGWNRALTDEEIQNNYNDAKKRFNF